jgi:hypothetical protein
VIFHTKNKARLNCSTANGAKVGRRALDLLDELLAASGRPSHGP